MKKNSVKLKLLITMIAVALVCCGSVLLVSIFTHRNNTLNYLYENIENKKRSIDLWISGTMESALVVATNLSKNPEFIEAMKNNDIETIITMADSIKHRAVLNYGFITDEAGNVLHRTHDTDINNGNVAHLEQITIALNGEVDSSITYGERNTLRISTAVPVFDENDDIIGTVTYGRDLDDAGLAFTLKVLVDSEITVFDGSSRISSTMSFSSITLLPNDIRDGIIHDVLSSGGTYRGILKFVNERVVSIVYPLIGTGDQIVGMLLIGINYSVLFGDVLIFSLLTSITAAIILTIVILLSLYISGNINKQFTSIINAMTHREKLFKAVNRASELLLEIDETDEIKDPLLSSMVVIGDAMSCDHVHLWQAKTAEDDCTRFVRDFSWVSDYAKTRTKAPKSITIVNDSEKLDWMEKFLKGEYISGIISEMPQSYKEHLKPLHTKSITMIPVFLENQFWGVFSIDFINKETVFHEDEVAIFRSISLMMANIVRRHALQSENLKVYTDALTGIHNRRFFDKSMRRIISSLSRTGGELSLMMIDIDYFKKYNDTYGHGPGDECLIKVAEILSDSVKRVDDFVARYGGEEFVAVLPNTGKEGAISVAEKMLENAREANIEHKASEVASHVSFSIGVITGIVTQFHTSENFLQSADDLLYKSKNDGRNRYTYGEMEEI